MFQGGFFMFEKQNIFYSDDCSVCILPSIWSKNPNVSPGVGVALSKKKTVRP
jgi:hypothetical protein